MRIIAIGNQKGGVGKTTTAINLAACLAELNRRVLLIDLDPQAAATRHLGLDPTQYEKTIYDCLIDHTLPIEKVIVEVGRLWLAPNNIRAVKAAREMTRMHKPDERLKLQLSRLSIPFDFCLLDCPPNLDMLTINAFWAADEIIICIQTEQEALQSALILVDELSEMMQVSAGTKEFACYILPTLYDRRTILHREVLDAVKQRFDPLVLQPISRTIRLAEARVAGKPITEYDRVSSGFTDYIRLAKELLKYERSERKGGVSQKEV